MKLIIQIPCYNEVLTLSTKFAYLLPAIEGIDGI